jgi:hypothetical protein
VFAIKGLGHHPVGEHPGAEFKPVFSIWFGKGHGLDDLLPEEGILSLWANKNLLASEPFGLMSWRQDFRLFLMKEGEVCYPLGSDVTFEIFEGESALHHVPWWVTGDLFYEKHKMIRAQLDAIGAPKEILSAEDYPIQPGCIEGNNEIRGNDATHFELMLGGQGFYEQYPEWYDAAELLHSSDLAVLASFHFKEREWAAYIINLIVDKRKTQKGILDDVYVHIEYW